MSVHPLGRGDEAAARRLWNDLGGWYRNTSPTSDADVERALGRLLRAANGGRRPRRGSASEAAWVAGTTSSPDGWLYARADPEQNYVIPLVPPEDGTGALRDLLASARTWFLGEQAGSFLIDVPEGRPDLRSAVGASGRRLWRRQVLDRNVQDPPASAPGDSVVRDFRRSDLAAAQSLFGTRHPGKLPQPIPVPFLELRGGWFRDPAWEVQRAIWVAGSRRELLGVAGGTYRHGSAVGFLGPWVLSDAASPDVAGELLGTVLGWLRPAQVQRLRTTVPVPMAPDAQTLLTFGFTPMAESDLYELRS